MRLSGVKIRNFKSLNNVELFIPKKDGGRPGSADFLSLVGSNNAGKSSILQAIQLACPGKELSKPTDDYFPYRDLKNSPMEIELLFDDIQEHEKNNWIINRCINEDKIEILRRWNTDDNEISSSDTLVKVPVYDVVGVNFDEEKGYVTKSELLSNENWKEVFEAFESNQGKIARYTKERWLEIFEFAKTEFSELVVKTEECKWENPTGRESNLLSIMPEVILIPAIRDSKEDVETSKPTSTASKILKYLFDRFLSSRKEVAEFQDAAKNVEKLFGENAKDQFVSRIEDNLTYRLQRLIDIEAKLAFSPPDVTADLAKNTRLWIRDKWSVENSVHTKPEHQGHGAQRAVILSLLELLIDLDEFFNQTEEGEQGYKKPLLLLIEEPEIYLHPHMCRKMRDTLLSLARKGLCQIICTTHSPVFLDLADRHDGIAIISRDEDSGEVLNKQLRNDLFSGDAESRDRLRMILNFDSGANEVFFTKRTTLVEGDCEIACIDALGEKFSSLDRLDFSRHLLARKDVSLINCRGKATIPAFQKVLNAFGIPYRVVHDSDSNLQGSAGTAAETINTKIAGLLGTAVSLKVHEPNFEQDIFGESWDKEKPWNARSKVLDLPEDFINDKLESFYYFVLHSSSEELQEPLESEDYDLEDLFSDEYESNDTFKVPRKNLRNSIHSISIDQNAIDDLKKDGVVELAAGPGRIPDLELSCTDEANYYFGEVVSDSMADTLNVGDYVRLKRLENIYLETVGEENDGVSHNEFSQHINNGGIYALSINDDIELGEYTLKRVQFKVLNDTEWICILSADNPDTKWGDRGKLVVRPTDRIHFAAEVDGLYVWTDESDGS